jgi:hypothetical protein
MGAAVSEFGEIAGEHYKGLQKRYEPPARLKDVNVLDDPQILGDLTWWTYNVSDMLPTLIASMAPAIGTYRTITGVGTVLGRSPEVVARFAKLGAIITGGTVGGALEASGTYETMLEKGLPEEEAARAAELMGLFTAGLNALSTGQLLSATGKGFMAKVNKAGLNSVVEGLTEGAEEPAEVVSKIAARLLTGQKIPDNISGMFIDSLKQGLTVAPIAGVTGFGGTVMGGTVQEAEEEISPVDTSTTDEVNKILDFRENLKRSTPEQRQELRKQLPADHPLVIEIDNLETEAETEGMQRAVEYQRRVRQTPVYQAQVRRQKEMGRVERVTPVEPESVKKAKAEKPVTKRQKARREYKEYVDSLTEEQRADVSDLILEKPRTPTVQKNKIQKKLKEIEDARSAREGLEEGREEEGVQREEAEPVRVRDFKEAGLEAKPGEVSPEKEAVKPSKRLILQRIDDALERMKKARCYRKGGGL